MPQHKEVHMVPHRRRLTLKLTIALALLVAGMPLCLAAVCSPPDSGYGARPSPWLHLDINASGGCAVYNGTAFKVTSLPSRVNVGLEVWSNSGSTLITGTFDVVSVGAYTPPYTTSWIGNSFPGGGPPVPQDVSAIYVDPGTSKVITNTYWDEGGRESTIFTSTGSVE